MQVRTALLSMADPAINVVVRDDSSGTTEIFTKALSLFSADFKARVGGNAVLDWCEDGMETFTCPTVVNGTDDVAGLVLIHQATFIIWGNLMLVTQPRNDVRSSAT
jgi:hypothetical protein